MNKSRIEAVIAQLPEFKTPIEIMMHISVSNILHDEFKRGFLETCEPLKPEVPQPEGPNEYGDFAEIDLTRIPFVEDLVFCAYSLGCQARETLELLGGTAANEITHPSIDTAANEHLVGYSEIENMLFYMKVVDSKVQLCWRFTAQKKTR